MRKLSSKKCLINLPQIMETVTTPPIFRRIIDEKIDPTACVVLICKKVSFNNSIDKILKIDHTQKKLIFILIDTVTE